MLTDVYNVAFRREIDILVVKSFDNTIDVEFGIYKDGKMTINLMPSEGNVDWAINLDFFSKKVKPSYAKVTSKVKIHKGFYKEWMNNRDEFFHIIKSNKDLLDALTTNGLYCVGRSKGGSEAAIIGLDIVRNFDIPKDNVYLGLLEAAKVGNKEFCKSVEEYISKQNIYTVRYHSDIITQIPPFKGYGNPGVKIQIGNKSIMPLVDHALGCFKEEELKVKAKKFDEVYDGTLENVKLI